MNAYMIHAALEFLLIHSNHRFDLHFCQLKNGEQIELVIKGNQKKDMAADIQEHLSKVIGVEVGTESQQKLKEFTEYIKKVIAEVFKQPADSFNFEDKLIDLNRLMYLTKQLDDKYGAQVLDEEVDETMFIKCSNVLDCKPRH